MKSMNIHIKRIMVTLHVSVWVEIHWICKIKFTIRSRSTWACELKCDIGYIATDIGGHAPRERVSWNFFNWFRRKFALRVTLHVSVWVEIPDTIDEQVMNFVTLHVSVWVEMTETEENPTEKEVTLHVSVWVEIVNLVNTIFVIFVTLHVSVWVEMLLGN